jgi:hypothetical protein
MTPEISNEKIVILVVLICVLLFFLALTFSSWARQQVEIIKMRNIIRSEQEADEQQYNQSIAK